MKLTKKLEQEIRQVYDTYWEGYMKGDMDTFSVILDEDVKVIGSTEGEVFFSKQEALDFYLPTADQIAGKAELRNRIITIEAAGNLVLVTELNDFYILIEDNWTYYTKARLSTFFHKKEGEWKIIQQHGSMPDIRAVEGEQFALEKISKENLELRDAVKRRTTELEQKNRELEIEASLERVRTVAMGMSKADDMLDVCRIISEQMGLLGTADIRNVQTAIFYPEKKIYRNYEYYCRHDKSMVTDVDYTTDKISSKFAQKMQSGAGEFFTESLKGEAVQQWYEFQKTTAQFPDPYLETNQSLTYYWSSLGPVAMGTSTYVPLTDDEIELFKRFRNVFELAYRRFLDIQQAAAQAHEAKIEAALERIRAVAMSLRKRDELITVCEAMYKELLDLGFTNIRNAQVAIKMDDKHAYLICAYSSFEQVSMKEAPYTSSPLVMDLYRRLEQSKDAFYQGEFTGDKYQEWRRWRETINAMGDPREFTAKSMWFYLYSIGTGHLGISTFDAISEEQVEIVKRFKNVFELSYQRYIDVTNAEAQAREAQIELALERVRARTMAMQLSGELAETASVLFKQIKDLGFDMWSCGFCIWSADDLVEVWMNADSGGLLPPMMIPYKNEPTHRDIYEASLRGALMHERVWEGEGLEKHYEFLQTIPSVEKAIDLLKKSGLSLPEKQCYYVGFFKQGYLLLITKEPKTGAGELANRFARVFDQTYTRFLDLQKAEEQARESQIELGLERVRARAMAMQKSDELKELIGTVFTELTKLDLVLTRCVIMIYDTKTNDSTWWMANSEAPSDPIGLTVQYHKHPPYHAYLKAWNEKNVKWTYSLEGKIKKEWDHFLFAETGLSHLPNFVIEGMKAPDKVYLNASFNSFGNLTLATLELLSVEHFDIMLRFAKVFDLTYTRFNDLQKAEAQAKEAEIELALERIRARTMAMQKSEELGEISFELFKQVQSLGIATWHCAFNIYDTDQNSSTEWGTNVGGIYPKYKTPRIGIFLKYYEIGKTGETLHIEVIGEDKIAAHYDWLCSLSGVGEELLKLKDKGISFPTSQIDHVAFFKYGYLLFISYEQVPEAHEIFKRFAIVFEQTYTRFLDLQKAEAQSKESQIQLALERVRARTMAMQKSDELRECVLTIYEQLQNLDFDSNACNIIIIDKESGDTVYWVSGFTQKIFPEGYHVPYLQHPYHENLLTAYRENKKYAVMEYSGEMKQSFDEIFFTQTDFRNIPEQAKQFIIGLKSQTLSTVFFTYGALQVLGAEAISDDKAGILQRFGIVFEQTYTRFLDLQKAEAQARESRIETSLERVRAATNAMHNSTDLLKVITILSEQFLQLGFKIDSANFNTSYRQKDWNLWLYNPGVPMYPDQLHIPYFDHPYFNRTLETLAHGNDFNAFVFNKQDKDAFLDHLYQNTIARHVSDERKKWTYEQPGFAWSVVYLANTSVTVANYAAELYTEEQNAILRRFANVFEQSYTRFLDLQKAEAQAREAKIEASLERVRSKAMAMHNSQDLADTIGVFYRELHSFSITPRRCGVGLLNKETRIGELFTWNTTEMGESLELVGRLKMEGHPVLTNVYENWLAQSDYFPVLRGNEIKEYNSIIRPQIAFPDYDNDDVQYGYFFFLKEGGVYAWTDKEMKEDELQIYRRFISVLSLTYSRYSDLQQAEGNMRESQIQLALERVRARTMAMQKSDELSDAAVVLFQQFAALGEVPDRISIGVVDEQSDTTDVWATDQAGTQLNVRFRARNDEKTTFVKVMKAWRAGEKSIIVDLQGEEFKNWLVYVRTELRMSINEENFHGRRIHNVSFFSQGWLNIVTIEPLPAETLALLDRFAAVFNLTYTRFLDLQKAEAQAREAKIEAALEKVRSRTLAMQKSDELSETAAEVFRQLIALGIEPNRLYIGLVNDENGEMEMWATDEDGTQVGKKFMFNKNENSSVLKLYDGWKAQKKSVIVDMQGEELEKYFHYLSNVMQIPFKGGLSQKRRVQSVAYFSKGFIGMASPDGQGDETIQLLERFAAVFNLTYTRFNDLQVAEAQTHKAKIETALERVRARALAMQQPEELKEVAEVLRHEMGLLGVEELETCSIYINDEQAEKAECWYALKDTKSLEKKLVNDHFALDLNDTWVGREMLQFYNSPVKQASIVMQGTNRKEWVQYCEKNSAAFRGYYGEIVPDRTYHLYKFSHGAIGAASAGDISNESWDLLQRAASVFSLAYSRFKDLTQARIDLQRLKEEKQRAEDALGELQVTQRQLIQSEKMASLGELTAGIAHEIQNPLNFVNNFSEVSTELLDEMIAELEKSNPVDAKAIANDVKQNLEKILHHGKRADGIVKGMLQHSRSSSGSKEPTNINELADEYLRLAYHGLRAKDKSFNAVLKTEYDETIGSINIIPQDIGRATLNLITNAFYAVAERKKQNGDTYEPIVSISTKRKGDGIEVTVRDNGNGIPQKVLDKIFQPFFTTKPTGQGTGLGLSLSYDIVKAHGGEIRVATTEGEGSEFVISLPG